jgi:hypothetical protein
MNVVFVGGGLFPTLPFLRGVLQNPKVIDGGEIRLVDFNLPRVETVARLIMRTPEFAKAGWRELLEIHRAELPAIIQKSKDYC